MAIVAGPALGGNSGVLPVKGGMYIHELERIPKDGLTGIQLKRNCGILPRSTDTTLSKAIKTM